MKPTNTIGIVPEIVPAPYTVEDEHRPLIPLREEGGEAIPLPFDDEDDEDFDTEEYIASLALPERYNGVITLDEYKDLTRAELDEQYYADNVERMNDIHGRMMDEDFKYAVSIEDFKRLCIEELKKVYGVD